MILKGNNRPTKFISVNPVEIGYMMPLRFRSVALVVFSSVTHVGFRSVHLSGFVRQLL